MKSPVYCFRFSAALTTALIAPISPAQAIVSVDFITVGNIGNPADPATGAIYGDVAYVYSIARNETTVGQYAAFLNSVAKSDPYRLYNTLMASGPTQSITRTGTDGNYVYSVLSGKANRPITFVNFYDSARFCNWLHNGQPVGFQTTETTEDGAYTLLGALDGGIITKNEAASVWIPTEDEWYKAAYYDPTIGPAGGYWAQATRSNSIGSNTAGGAGAANYFDGDYVGTGTATYPSNNALTDVGAYGAASQSYYGTNDQAGNVWEWNAGNLGGSAGEIRGVRGGTWYYGPAQLAASYRASGNQTDQSLTVGFRLASVPEPMSLALAGIAGVMISMRRKR